jgi:RimJ/RimL family protein N-acetyltransferase
MNDLKLVAIAKDGNPSENIGPLPEIAREVGAANAAFYEAVGFVPPWIAYFALRESDIVGTCAFKGRPGSTGVEIAYFTFPDHEGRGIGTAMARRLLTIAHSESSEIPVIAHTLPEKNASTAILSRLGFVCEGEVEDPDDGTVWRWGRRASAN